MRHPDTLGNNSHKTFLLLSGFEGNLFIGVTPQGGECQNAMSSWSFGVFCSQFVAMGNGKLRKLYFAGQFATHTDEGGGDGCVLFLVGVIKINQNHKGPVNVLLTMSIWIFGLMTENHTCIRGFLENSCLNF